jgi:hypothetical protein
VRVLCTNYYGHSNVHADMRALVSAGLLEVTKAGVRVDYDSMLHIICKHRVDHEERRDRIGVVTQASQQRERDPKAGVVSTAIFARMRTLMPCGRQAPFLDSHLIMRAS